MPRRDPIVQCVDDIKLQVEILRRHHEVLEEQYDRGGIARDGYPTSSLGGHGSATNELDDDGTPIPQHSDPTGRAVEQRDADRVVQREIEDALYLVRRILDGTLSTAKNAAAPPAKIDKAANDRSIWCTHHASLGFGAEPVRDDAPDTGLCRFCADWARDAQHRHEPALEDGTANPDHDRNWPLRPPRIVLERRSQGRNITNAVLREAGLGPRTDRYQRLSKKQLKRARRAG